MLYRRKPWEHEGKTITKILNPTTELKQQAVDLLYDIGKHILTAYNFLKNNKNYNFEIGGLVK